MAARAWPGRAGGLLRRHWLFALLFAAGTVFRVITQIAYRPALFYIDSIKYLLGAYPGNDPVGYSYALKPVLAVAGLGAVAAIQHLLGLAMAMTLYLVLRRRGVPQWLAALAAAPILLDAYQLQIEQTIMPEVMFETCVVAGFAALLWYARPPVWLVLAAGLALGAAATARQVGEILAVPALAYAACSAGRRRTGLRNALVLAEAFVIPVACASFYYYQDPAIHQFSLAPRASQLIYGRFAAAADCATLRVPPYEKPLCPTAAEQAKGPDWLVHDAASPDSTLKLTRQLCVSLHRTRSTCWSTVVSDFDHQVARQQPGRVLASVGSAALTLFAVDRDVNPGDTPISRWQFQDTFSGSIQNFRPYIEVKNGGLVFSVWSHRHTGIPEVLGTGAQFGAGTPSAIPALARFLRAYQLDGGYTPGPLLLLCVLAGVLGSVFLLWRRASAADRLLAGACALFFTSGAAVLLMSDVFEFTWRYQLPALITLPPAGALAVALAIRHWSQRDGARPVAQRGDAAAAGPRGPAHGGVAPGTVPGHGPLAGYPGAETP